MTPFLPENEEELSRAITLVEQLCIITWLHHASYVQYLERIELTVSKNSVNLEK